MRLALLFHEHSELQRSRFKRSGLDTGSFPRLCETSLASQDLTLTVNDKDNLYPSVLKRSESSNRPSADRRMAP